MSSIRSSLFGFLVGSTVSLSTGYYFLLHEPSPLTKEIIKSIDTLDIKTTTLLNQLLYEQREFKLLFSDRTRELGEKNKK